MGHPRVFSHCKLQIDPFVTLDCMIDRSLRFSWNVVTAGTGEGPLSLETRLEMRIGSTRTRFSSELPNNQGQQC